MPTREQSVLYAVPHGLAARRCVGIAEDVAGSADRCVDGAAEGAAHADGEEYRTGAKIRVQASVQPDLHKRSADYDGQRYCHGPIALDTARTRSQAAFLLL